jgi:peptidoglycan hydrolase FlgJ
MPAAITDFNQFAALRKGADNNDPAVLREVAGQFEALFIQTMLKNMRDTSLADPIFGQSDQYEMYQGMLDQQLSLEMSGGKGIGLAEMLVRQLGGKAEENSGDTRTYGLTQVGRSGQETMPAVWKDPGDFARDVWPHAKRAADQLNVAPEALLAQAALETGWGRYVMSSADGESSFNFFGVKAGQSWDGGTVSKPTIEYRDGAAARTTAKFRSYENVAATFDDYVDLINNSVRYDDVAGHGADTGGFATALQNSGYATDPKYADKIKSILGSGTMQRALAGLKSAHTQPITHQQNPGEVL